MFDNVTMIKRTKCKRDLFSFVWILDMDIIEKNWSLFDKANMYQKPQSQIEMQQQQQQQQQSHIENNNNNNNNINSNNNNNNNNNDNNNTNGNHNNNQPPINDPNTQRYSLIESFEMGEYEFWAVVLSDTIFFFFFF